MSRVLIVAVCMVLAQACHDSPQQGETAIRELSKSEQIIAQAIQASGTYRLDSATVSYSFRDNIMGFDRQGDSYVYTRERIDSSGNVVIDALANTEVRRFVNGEVRQLSPKQATAASEGVNSITYFAFLPLWLQDDAVQSIYQGLDTINNKSYHRLHISFAATNGGQDFKDEFLYWFDTSDDSLDYLAYVYATNGGGVRFREAINVREVNGVTIQDYNNYSAEPENSIDLQGMLAAYKANKLKLLSTIALNDVKIRYAD